ncbi:NAD(P)H-dependent oxidoreductase [Aestuariibacter sp. AA17]|uniref:NAD(P)H-dependent oxidoreductase n=1 Tax=Fluctibacter corallii TaxID=2984329 RepID=A0ABT3A4A1_9ALTE|nr:NAD(P)H-dependent oxidoreductase [Aestuariibacter sp. AA17]MCV2883423.1 NAD(P)H-dependent oxidoreductase [Aestuariibacter sp. AA17]
MNVIDALNWRYSVKRFADKLLSREQVNGLIEAARLSPSSYGLQPYRIIVIESAVLRQQILPLAYNQTQVVTSSHLLLFAARTDVDLHMAQEYAQLATQNKDVPEASLARYVDMIESSITSMNTLQRQQWAHQQVYIALGNVLTSAAMMGIDTSPIGGFDSTAVDALLGLNDKQLASTVLCPIGYRHNEDPYSQRRKVRFAQSHLVMEM